MTKKKGMEKCPLCKSKFKPKRGQLPAWWNINWCTSDHGLLCPPCHAVAERHGAVSADPCLGGLIPFGSDIVKEAGTVSEKDWLKHRRSESWRTWVEENHPEWI